MPLARWLPIAAEAVEVVLVGMEVEVEVEVEVVLALDALPAAFRGDPADRIIVATARARSLALATHDRAIRQARLARLWRTQGPPPRASSASALRARLQRARVRGAAVKCGHGPAVHVLVAGAHGQPFELNATGVPHLPSPRATRSNGLSLGQSSTSVWCASTIARRVPT